MLILAIDTASTLCAACVFDGAADRELGRSVLDLGKGHAEHLMAVIDRVLAQSDKTYRDINRIAVCVGPGSFTGVRVGVSTARGLALTLRIPAIGVTSLDAIAAEARDGFPQRPVLAALDAGRSEINVALYDPLGMLVYGPTVTTLSEAVELATLQNPILAGSAARTIADNCGLDIELGPTGATADILTYARLAAGRNAGEKPRPLYLRAADAKPQAGFVLARQTAP